MTVINMTDRFQVCFSSSRGDELCGGAITRTAAIEVAQRVFVDVVVAEGKRAASSDMARRLRCASFT